MPGNFQLQFSSNLQPSFRPFLYHAVFRTMSTYTSNFTTFKAKLEQATSLIPLSKLGIGLEDDTNVKISEAELNMRVKMIQDFGVKEIDIWQAPIPDNWMPALRKFGNNA